MILFYCHHLSIVHNVHPARLLEHPHFHRLVTSSTDALNLPSKNRQKLKLSEEAVRRWTGKKGVRHAITLARSLLYTVQRL